MSDLILKSLDINNFRSIRGQIHVPLDAKVVLVHGENGAGKTSLLSAIELALTGKIQSLERADPGYEKQLVHWSANESSVHLKTLQGASEQSFKAALNASGLHSNTTIDKLRATFFRERAFLPQSLLGQLLQIYQDSGSGAASPLAQFVATLLGLDQLDSLEAGLKPLADVRNVRKNVDGWLAAENEKSRLDRLLFDQRKARDELDAHAKNGLSELAKVCTALGLPIKVQEESLDEVEAAVLDGYDLEAFDRLTDQQRKLASIQREIHAARSMIQAGAALKLSSVDDASKAFASWEEEYGERVSLLRVRVEALLPNISLGSDLEHFGEVALKHLRVEQKQLSERALQARTDIIRHGVAQNERDVALQQRDTIDLEVSRLSTSAGSFGSVLSELTAFITDETCPVCDRDFTEISQTPLRDHVHGKVRMLSASAERLLTLGRTRSEAHITIERLSSEIEVIAARRLDENALAELERRSAAVTASIAELETILDALREGARLRAANVTARRAVSEAQARHISLATARDTLNEFAVSIGAPKLEDGESFETASVRLTAHFQAQAAKLEERLSMRRRSRDYIATIRSALLRRKDADDRILVDHSLLQRADQALLRAQTMRDQGNIIRSTVDRIRSTIIRREFNDRLNRVWRDLFIRLAPGEPFIPAFRIPESSTHKLQPKLITEHRDGGGAGGTPGAMLSAGNLNTAALSLFIALHLSVPRELPWLILDDPVQSMDDIHIAQFAALLKTLAKEHKRQVMIAVHDRQLFEYLKLELSPAFPDDSLLTLELSRGPRRDSICISQRFSFKEETALLVAA